MLKQIKNNLNLDKDYPERSRMIDLFTRVLNGELYDKLPFAFSQEYDSGRYIPLSQRQPSVVTNLCKVVVDESVSLLFGSDHFPDINIEDLNDEEEETVKESVDKVVKGIDLRKIMLEAALTGSVGSVVLFLRIIEGEPQVEVKGTQYLTPIFDPKNPKKIIRLIEKFKVKGSELKNQGYVVEGNNIDYWFRRDWTEDQEIFYIPYRGKDDSDIKIDDERTIDHNLGFVPAVWIKNLPKPSSKGFSEVDGACTFAGAIDITVEIDYLLSQGGRALKYSADPFVIFKVSDDGAFASNAMPVAGDVSGQKKVIRSSSNAFVLGPDDDAKLLEITGKASEAMIGHVRYLRELAMEGIHGNRSHADKQGAHLSGTAQDKLNQSLIWLTDILRVYYGDNGMVPLLKMIFEASRKTQLEINGDIIPPMPTNNITLNWPPWNAAAPSDRKQIAETLRSLTDAGILSKESATKFVAEDYNITDVEDELQKIASDQEKLAEQAPQIKEVINA